MKSWTISKFGGITALSLTGLSLLLRYFGGAGRLGLTAFGERLRPAVGEKLAGTLDYGDMSTVMAWMILLALISFVTGSVTYFVNKDKNARRACRIGIITSLIVLAPPFLLPLL